MADHPTWTHADHTITLDIAMLFVVTGPHVDGTFSSYREAITKIDEAAHKHELASRKRISIAVLTEDGLPRTITGIHASNGSILGLPKDYYRYGNGRFYPDIAWIADTIEQMHDLMRQTNDLRKKLKPFEITSYEASGSHTDDHGTRVDNLVATIEEKRAAAGKLVPSDEGAKP